MSTQKTEHHPLDIQIGKRIRKQRLICGLSQKKLGEKLGVSPQQIQKYESGLTSGIIDKLCKLAEILSVDTSYFLVKIFEDEVDIHFYYGDGDIDNGEISRFMREYRKIKDETLYGVVHSVMKLLANK